MSSYISSNNNRFYAVIEPAYGQVPAVTSQNRIPAVKLTARQQVARTERKDKTGTRTYFGDPSGLRNSTSFSLNTYLTAWTNTRQEPAYGPLFQACMGSAANIWNGGTIVSAPGSTRVSFAAPHGLTFGQAVTVGNDLRFVANIVDSQTVQLNAPLSSVPGSNTLAGPTATYQPAEDLPSASIFDCWSPSTAVQRVLCGAALDQMTIKVNGDFHEFSFSGRAADILDSTSFQNGQGGLTSFPQEPALSAFDYTIIPGHLGQAWLGTGPGQFFTITKAQLTFKNELALRDQEFGTTLAAGITPGLRNVSLELSLFQRDDANTQALYQAARSRSPVPMMLQLGQQPGELFGIYMKAVVLEVPEFDDSETRQQWHFVTCRAQGGLNDELFIAFG